MDAHVLILRGLATVVELSVITTAACLPKDSPFEVAKTIVEGQPASCSSLSNTRFRIKASERESCVDSTHALGSGGAAIPVKSVCTDAIEETWQIICAEGEGSSVIHSLVETGGCLAPSRAGEGQPTFLSIEPCSGEKNQQWFIGRDVHERVMIRNAKTKQCLDFDEAHYHYGEPFALKRCEAKWSQLWLLQPR